MTPSLALELVRGAMTTGLILLAPVLIGTLVVGVLVSLIQAMTQINEMTLTFVPKVLVVAGIVAFLGPWMASTFLSYSRQMFELMAQLAR